eukprot:scaffold305_cov247-Pinguiococcus_pyrenoidosus.AAC.6
MAARAIRWARKEWEDPDPSAEGASTFLVVETVRRREHRTGRRRGMRLVRVCECECECVSAEAQKHGWKMEGKLTFSHPRASFITFPTCDFRSSQRERPRRTMDQFVRRPASTTAASHQGSTAKRTNSKQPA